MNATSKAAAALALSGMLVSAATPAAGAPEDARARIAGQRLTPASIIESAERVQNDAEKGAPAYFEARDVVRRVPISQTSVFVRLPHNWNRRPLGIGGGGASGTPKAIHAIPGLKARYATAQSDAGHTDTGAILA